jgi:hypothetical protein
MEQQTSKPDCKIPMGCGGCSQTLIQHHVPAAYLPVTRLLNSRKPIRQKMFASPLSSREYDVLCSLLTDLTMFATRLTLAIRALTLSTKQKDQALKIPQPLSEGLVSTLLPKRT